MIVRTGIPKPPALSSSGGGRSRHGCVHATLPTKLSVPMGSHLQSSWLLSIDRQDVQALSDNAWNSGLLSQLPRVCVLLLRWVAATHSGELSYSKSRFTVLPRMSRSERGQLTIEVLETDVDATIVEKAVRSERLVPILVPAKPGAGESSSAPSGETIEFVRAQQAVRVPEAFFGAGLTPTDLEQWLGLPPLAMPAMGSFGASPLWDCLPQLDSNAVRRRAEHLARMLGQAEGQTAKAQKGLMVLAAFADEGLRATKDDEEVEHSLGSFEQWPVFLTKEGTCVTASRLRWPEEDFWRAPMAIQQLLEPHILEQPQRQRHSSEGHGSSRGHRGKHKRQQQPRQSQDVGHLLDSTLQRMLQAAPAAGGPVRLSTWKSAVTCMNQAKTISSTVVALDGIIQRFFDARANLRGEEMAKAVSEIVTVTAWCCQRRMGHRISQVLVGEEASGFRLVQPRKVYLGAPYTETKLSELAGDDVACVSSCYDNATALPVSCPNTRGWRELFLSLGCNEGLRFEPRASTLQRSEHRLLPDGKLPPLRKSAKTVVLPYGLGTMANKQLKVIDCALSAEWEQLLRQLSSRAAAAGSEESPACTAFVAMLTRLQLDDATHPDAKSTPSAAPAIAGRESDPAARPLKPVPARKRLIYLAPGQPGAAMIDLGEAEWVRRIASTAWVLTERGTKRPSQCSLWTEREKGYRAGMPMAKLPDDVLRALKQSKIHSILGFGTADPPKAMERLREVAAATTDSAAACSDEELADIWRGICAAEKQGKLPASEVREAQRLATKLPLLPGLASSPGSRVPIARCVAAPRAEAASSDSREAEGVSDAIDSRLVEAMTSAGWLVDVSHPSWALVGVSDSLIALLGIPSVVRTAELGPFVGWLCESQPPMTPVLRDGMTIATHRVLQQIRPQGSGGFAAAFDRQIGRPLTVYCGAGPGALTASWRDIGGGGAEGEGAGVRPVINDDADKASMMQKEHGFQFCGTFDHVAPSSKGGAAADTEFAATLFAMDKQIIAKLRIPTLSSPDFSVRVQTRGEGEALVEAKARLSYVLELLREWCRNAGLPAVEESLLAVKDVKRFKQIVKTFSVPGAKPIKSSVWAVWRRSGAVLLCGDGEDYVAELQAEVYQRIGGLLRQHQSQSQGLFPGKVLNLLNHCESHRRFEKFLKRDHGIDIKDVEALASTIPAVPADDTPSIAPARELRPEASAAVPAGRGRGAMNKPAWMTTGDLGQAPPAETPEDKETTEKQQALASELRQMAAQGGSADAKKRKAMFADAEEGQKKAATEDPAAAERAKGMAADFLDQMQQPASGAAAAPPAMAPMGAPAGRGRGVDVKPAWMTTVRYALTLALPARSPDRRIVAAG